MLWVLKRTVSMRQFFWAPKTYAKNYGLENIYNFTLIFFVYLNLWEFIPLSSNGFSAYFLSAGSASDAAEITDKMLGDKSDSLTQFYYTADCFDIMHIYQVYAKYANCVIVGQ